MVIGRSHTCGWLTQNSASRYHAECDLQCRLYDKEHCVDLNRADYSELIHDPTGREFLESGRSWSDLWIRNDLQRIPYDEHFMEVLNYALTH